MSYATHTKSNKAFLKSLFDGLIRCSLVATLILAHGPAAAAAVPSAPTDVAASAGDASATIFWLAPADNGSPITSYIVTATPGGLKCNSTTTNCVISGLTNGVSYTFKVVATNAIGNSADSIASNAVTPRPDFPPVFTLSDIAAHGTTENCWTAVLGEVYDLNVGIWFSSLAASSKSKAEAAMCGKVGTAYWSTDFGDFDPAVVLETSHIASFDLSSITERIRKAEVQYGPNTCWTAYGAGVYDLSMLVKQYSGDTKSSVVALCKKQPSAESMLSALGATGLRYTDLAIYKIAAYVEPFKVRFPEVTKHARIADCWTLLNRTVYDLTPYWQSHSNNATIRAVFCGKDTTLVWGAKSIAPFKRYAIASLLGTAPSMLPKTSIKTVQLHRTTTNCWAAVGNYVYRISPWLSSQNNKSQLSRALCGKLATRAFQTYVQGDPAVKWSAYLVGRFG